MGSDRRTWYLHERGTEMFVDLKDGTDPLYGDFSTQVLCRQEKMFGGTWQTLVPSEEDNNAENGFDAMQAEGS